MFGRIANILGWAGVALVLAGVATWLFRDDLVTLRQGFALAGLVCILVYAASQWREMAGTFTQPMVTSDGKTIPPTGKKFKIPMATIAHWKGGKFDKEYLFWDNQTFMRQIGLG